ncbi:uncharacterized protein LOC114790793 [Denticeps clupeoides]|uniref:Ig-like domain-containing protein n=1 Tax=Denticeps clupeoides TaxID=299321 RepID=A0AAY4A004_9TELE|nr:uncharacterized protein LOC114790793 [Denticeps clupeoides]
MLKVQRLWILLSFCAVSIDSDLFYAAESDPISIECKTYIKGGIYEWLHNNQKILTVNDKSGMTQKGNIPITSKVRALGNLLKISNLQKGDSGQFVCKVPGHPDDVHTLHVISVSASPSGAWLLSAPAELRCETGQSSEAKTEWLKNNEIVHSEGVKTIKSVARSDEGRWTCKITTEDKRIFTKTLDITVIGLSGSQNVTARLGNSATLPCSLTPPNLGSLRVVGGGWKQMSGAQRKLCLPTLNASAGLHWTAEETHSDCEPRVKGLKGALSTNFSVTVSHVGEDDAGQYICSLTFQQGEISTEVTLQVSKGNKIDKPDKRTPYNPDKANQFWLHWKIWTWVGVGVLAFVIILLVVVLCCLRNKRMKGRRKRLKAVRPPLTANDYCQCNRLARQPQRSSGERPLCTPQPHRNSEKMEIKTTKGRRTQHM